ncbi:MAG: glycosyltransferase family 2 protein, partial [Dehalococcoidia bacterium]
MMTEEHPNSSESRRSKIVAAIPCFNEERFIGSVVIKAREYADTVVVIDDGSEDGSAWIAEAAGAEVYRHGENRGYGAAIRSCMERGRALGADILVTIDGDGQHDPAEIPAVIRPIVDGEADVVVGSRFLGHESGAPFYRRLGQRALTTFTNLGSGAKITDSQSGCRAYSESALEKLDVSEDGMSVSSEIQFALKQAGLRVVEVPIDVNYDDAVKRNPVGHGFNVMVRVVVLFILRHPLLSFGLPGLAFLGGGLAMGLRVIDIYSDT